MNPTHSKTNDYRKIPLSQTPSSSTTSSTSSTNGDQALCLNASQEPQSLGRNAWSTSSHTEATVSASSLFSQLTTSSVVATSTVRAAAATGSGTLSSAIPITKVLEDIFYKNLGSFNVHDFRKFTDFLREGKVTRSGNMGAALQKLKQLTPYDRNLITCWLWDLRKKIDAQSNQQEGFLRVQLIKQLTPDKLQKFFSDHTRKSVSLSQSEMPS